MNTIYRVVWNSSTNSWVVASEVARGRKKASSSKVATGGALIAALSTLSFAPAVLAAAGGYEACGTAAGDFESLNGSQSCTLKQDGWIENYGIGLFTNGKGWNASANDPASLILSDKGFVRLDATDKIIMDQKMSMESNYIFNLKAGTAADHAVNVSQLQGMADVIGDTTIDPTTGAITGPDFGDMTGPDGSSATTIIEAMEGLDAGAVKYDAKADGTPNYNSVTLGDGSADYNPTTKTGGTSINNVAKGVEGGDAVNVDQLNDRAQALTEAGMKFAGDSGSVSRKLGETLSIKGSTAQSGKTYSSQNLTTEAAADGSVTIKMIESPKFGGITINDTGRISGLSAGVNAGDAVNVDQLKGVTGIIGGGVTVKSDGTVSDKITVNNVAYNTVAEAIAAAGQGGTPIDALKWDGTNGVYTAKHDGTDAKIANLANGTVAQNSKEAVNGGQLYNTASTVAGVIGGDTTVNPATGAISGTDFGDLKGEDGTSPAGSVIDALQGLDGRVDDLDTDMAGMVKYDSKLDGTPNFESVTLGGTTYNPETKTGGTRIKNVAKGVDGGDAVNVDQLKDRAQELTNAGMNFAGDSGSVSRKLGETLSIKGSTAQSGKTYSSQNLTTEAANGSVVIKMIQSPTFDSIVINNGGQIDMGGGKIINVGHPGEDNTAAANKQYVDDAIAAIPGPRPDTDALKWNGALKSGAGAYDASHAADGTPNKIVNLDKGLVAAESTEAVNGAQLYNTANTVAGVIGGNTTVNPTTGAISGTNFGDLKGGDGTSPASSIIDALQGLDGRVADLDVDMAGVVKYDSIDGTPNLNSVTLGGTPYNPETKEGGTSIKNVAIGTDRADAVNVQQLADALGGGSIDPGGHYVGPTYNIHNQAGDNVTVHNVGDAVTNLDGRTTKNTQDITNIYEQINDKGIGLVRQDTTTRDINVAKDTDGKKVNFAGTEGDRTLGGVAVGKADNDAVNVKQLKDAGVIDGDGNSRSVVTYDDASKTSVTLGGAGATAPTVVHNMAAGVHDNDGVNVAQLNDRLKQANSYTDARIDDVWQKMGNEINEVNRQANKGIAAASALINVTPYLPGKTAVNAGVASYRGEAALGVGVSRWSDNGRVNFNAGVSAAKHDEPVFRVGIGYVF